jgi:hypothetical protein
MVFFVLQPLKSMPYPVGNPPGVPVRTERLLLKLLDRNIAPIEPVGDGIFALIVSAVEN